MPNSKIVYKKLNFENHSSRNYEKITIFLRFSNFRNFYYEFKEKVRKSKNDLFIISI